MAKRKYVGHAIVSEYDSSAFSERVDRICKSNNKFVPEITFRTHVHNNQLVLVAFIAFYSEKDNDD